MCNLEKALREQTEQMRSKQDAAKVNANLATDDAQRQYHFGLAAGYRKAARLLEEFIDELFDRPR